METGQQDPVLATYRRMTLLAVLVAVFLSGVAEADPILFERTKRLARGVVALGLAFWCAADATLRGRFELWHVQWQLWGSWPVMLPAYLIDAHRWRAVRILLVSAASAIAVDVSGRLLGEYLLDE